MTRALWRTSTHSGGNGGECVEIANNLASEHGVVLVRDSKNQAGPMLRFTCGEWTAFAASM
jgi:hypothetical protein